MKKNINYNYKYNSDYVKRNQMIKESGFDGVFIYSQYNPQDYIESIIKCGLSIETLHLPYKLFKSGECIDSKYVNSIWLDNDATTYYTNTLIREVDFASYYGIKKVVMHITGGDNPPIYNESGLKVIEKLLNHCVKHNIFLCLENLRRLDYLKYVFDNLYSEYLKFCFDSGHANYMTNNANSFPWNVFGKHLLCLHLNDNYGMKDTHSIPFAGNILWNILIDEIKYWNPNIELTLEVRAAKEQIDDLTEIDFLNECNRSLTKIERLFMMT